MLRGALHSKVKLTALAHQYEIDCCWPFYYKVLEQNVFLLPFFFISSIYIYFFTLWLVRSSRYFFYFIYICIVFSFQCRPSFTSYFLCSLCSSLTSFSFCLFYVHVHCVGFLLAFKLVLSLSSSLPVLLSHTEETFHFALLSCLSILFFFGSLHLALNFIAFIVCYNDDNIFRHACITSGQRKREKERESFWFSSRKYKISVSERDWVRRRVVIYIQCRKCKMKFFCEKYKLWASLFCSRIHSTRGK